VSYATLAYFLFKGRRLNPCHSVVVTVSWHRLSIPGKQQDRTSVQVTRSHNPEINVPA
jgi:hypothetical protein